MTPLEVSMQWSWDRRTLSYPQESYPLGKGQVKSRVKLRTCPWKYQHLWHTSREMLVPVKMNAIAAFSLPSKPDQGLPQSSVWKTELNQKSPWQVRSSDAHSCVIAWPPGHAESSCSPACPEPVPSAGSMGSQHTPSYAKVSTATMGKHSQDHSWPNSPSDVPRKTFWFWGTTFTTQLLFISFI